ncbi:MAG: LptF/LptG family permease [Candidatus Eremiobacteraeota bacterium]|nr:LptF/LptG family permease [Candidatus Eremiobacteraeota bacterium]
MAQSPLRLRILDRYMLTEMSGPFGFGLSAFTLIFAATQIINIGRLVSQQHAPLWAAVEVFLWQLPGIFVLVLPMALLLGTLLAIQRLSGESEITAMKAGGITFLRVVAPMLAAGFLISFVMLFLQEEVVPYASDEVSLITETAINHTTTFNQDLTVKAPLPGGGQQVTFAASMERRTQALLHVTMIQYNAAEQPTQIIFADKAQFSAEQWVLENASTYRFNPDGTIFSEPRTPTTQVQIGEKPTDILKRVVHNNPEEMSRAQIAEIIRSGQLAAGDLKKYTETYQEKLALPFACFVFTLIAVPFGLRSTRGGGNASLGFGLAVAIVFVYYIVLTIFSYVGSAALWLAPIAAWMPNIIFTVIGGARLRRAAAI